MDDVHNADAASANHTVRVSRFLGVRTSAIIEMVVLFSLLLFYDSYIGNDTRFASSPIHPFWGVLLLVVTQYGLPEALACTIAASVLMLAGHMPQQLMTDTLYDYFLRVSRLPLLWLIVSVVAGQIRSRHIEEKERLLDELEESHHREMAVAREYNHLKTAKEKLEARLSEESASMVSVYHAATALQTFDEAGLQAGMRTIVATALRPEAFSLFLLQGNALELSFSHGWSAAGHGKSFAASSALYEAIVTAKKTLCVIRPEDEIALSGEGVIAVPVFDPRTGKVFGMLKIEKIALARVTFHTLQTFARIAEWSGMAIANARIHNTPGHATPHLVSKHG